MFLPVERVIEKKFLVCCSEKKAFETVQSIGETEKFGNTFRLFMFLSKVSDFLKLKIFDKIPKKKKKKKKNITHDLEKKLKFVISLPRTHTYTQTLAIEGKHEKKSYPL